MMTVDRQDLAALQRVLFAAISSEHRLHQLADRQERQTKRWMDRAEWAAARGEDRLAAQALQRGDEHRRRAARLREMYHAEAARIRTLKGQLRELEAGRGPPLLLTPWEDPLEARFQALQREERLGRDLAELKARLIGPQSAQS